MCGLGGVVDVVWRSGAVVRQVSSGLTVPRFGGEEYVPGCNPCLALARPTEAGSMSVVSFVKVSPRLLSILQVASGENYDPLDRALAVLQCHIHLEGVVLESMVRLARLCLFVMPLSRRRAPTTSSRALIAYLLIAWTGLGRCSCSFAPLYLILGVCVVVLSYMCWVVWSLLYI